MAQANEGFKEEFFADLIRLEADNFWFKSRNKLIIKALETYFPQARTLLEIGCGTGFVLAGIKKKHPELILSGSEIYSSGLALAGSRVAGQFYQMDAKKIPFDHEFDVIGAFDMLEHVEEDVMVLQQMHKALAKGGGIIVTVPQHQFLWSHLDEYGCHVRRYQAKDLKGKIERAGFIIVKATSFVTLLLPFMILSRYFKRRPNKIDILAELALPRPVNYLFEKCLEFEQLLLRTGLTLPMGGSLLIVAKKRA